MVLSVPSFFLNIGVIFADFKNCGNLLNFNDSINSVSTTGTNMSILSLIILLGISDSCEVLEQSRFFSSFSISIAWISWKRKLTFLFSLLIFISFYLLLFKDSDISSFSDMISSSSNRIILSWIISLSVKNGFTLFNNFFVISDIYEVKIIKVIFFCFSCQRNT